ncbi:aa3-type cytochrome c oxidase subunit IV [Sulfitobacter sp. LCG007]
MAEHKIGEMDISAQEQTFDSFMTFVTRTVIVILLILVGLAVFFH